MSTFFDTVVKSAVEEAGQLVEAFYLMLDEKPERAVAIQCELLVFPCLPVRLRICLFSGSLLSILSMIKILRMA